MKYRLSLGGLILLASISTAAAQNEEERQFDLPPVGATAQGDDEDLDRPMSRALAFDRRDFVEDLVFRPAQLSTHDVDKLARDLTIPRADAERVIEMAKAKAELGNLDKLIKAGLPQGLTVAAGVNLERATLERLVELGMSQQQAREFIRWRKTARRVVIHTREVQAVREVKIKGEATMAESARRILRGNGLQKVQAIAQALGLVAPEATEARAAERLAKQNANQAREVMEPMRPDPLVEFRRADGTLDWRKMTKSETLRSANGVIHFAFSLFLKELVVVMNTGDDARLGEFLDGLVSTDFYVNYGLFAIGARTADAMYGQFARRIAKKRFVSGVMRSNLVLAAGLAVPMIVRGQFSLDTYLVDVAALGLSATAVKAAIEGGKGVFRLVRGGRGALQMGRLATPAGWVFTAAETAVVLLIGDVLADKFDEYLDERQLRGAINDSKDSLWTLLKAVEDGEDISEEEMEAAIMAVEAAYNNLRDRQTDPLKGRLASFQGQMDSMARQALRGDSQLVAMERALKENKNLAMFFANRHGSTEAYLDKLRADTTTETEGHMDAEAQSFAAEWNSLLSDVYVGETASDHPAPAEGSRLATYDEQTGALLDVLDSTQDPEARQHIALAIARVRMARTLDQRVYNNGASAQSAADTATTHGAGIVQNLPASGN